MKNSSFQVTPENQQIARFVAGVFGGEPSVHIYKHDTLELSMPILFAPGQPDEEVSSYSTVGLSDYPLLKNGAEFPTRIELAGLCLTRHADHFPNVLTALAFSIIRESLFVYPGAHLTNCVNRYYPDTTVPHIYFWDPHFLWEDQLVTRKFGAKTVSWLLAVPISEPERQYLVEHGDEAFERFIGAKGVDIYHLWRHPGLEPNPNERDA